MGDNLVVEHLRHIRFSLDALNSKVRDVELRLTGVEIAVGAMRRELGGLAEADAHIHARLDRLGERMDRIERRLDLIGGA